MNYDFFSLRLGTVGLHHVQALLQQVDQLEYFNRYFKEGVLMGVSQDLTYNNMPGLRDLVNDCTQGMTQWLKPTSFISASVDKMEPQSYVNEHSDTGTTPWSNHRHKIHIPLKTNDKVGFAWSDNPHTVQMLEGEAFLYNNDKRHSVMNLGTEVRYHLILRYRPGAFYQLPSGIDESLALAVGAHLDPPPMGVPLVLRQRKGG